MTSTGSLPAYNKCFNVVFDNGHTAKAIRIAEASDTLEAIKQLGFDRHYPVIFVSGGASNMSQEDRELTREMVESVCDFAISNNAMIVDGGTESGIMQMLGDVRLKRDKAFPLVGVSPMGKVSYPGYKNPNEEAFLEDSHSHFVLVDGKKWGDESTTILALADLISGKGKKPAVGVLINGGKIAMHEIYLATTSKRRISIIVLEGSGRAADDISTAFRTGKANQRILQAILSGGDIQLVGTLEGPQAMRDKLAAKFNAKSE